MLEYKTAGCGYCNPVEESAVDDGGGDVGENLQSECEGDRGREEGEEEGKESEVVLHAQA